MTRFAGRSRRNGAALELALAAAMLIALPLAAQYEGTWRTAADIPEGSAGTIVATVTAVNEARTTLTVRMDEELTDVTVTVLTDPLVTRYLGFGEEGEVMTGSTGFSEVRPGDRIRVRGEGRGHRTIDARQITLLGRTVAAAEEAGAATIEGVVVAVQARGDRVTIETDGGAVVEIATDNRTPVDYRGETYRVRNLEPGDRIRVATAETAGGGLYAESIEVVQNIAEQRRENRTITSLYGRIVSIDAAAGTFRLDRGREGEVVVEARQATRANGDPLRFGDLERGDRVEVSGQFRGAGAFRADVVRFASERGAGSGIVYDTGGEARRLPAERRRERLAVIEGTITSDLREAAVLEIRDSDSGETIRVLVHEDFIVTRSGGDYGVASELRRGMTVVVRAFVDASGDYIAQTIRER